MLVKPKLKRCAVLCLHGHTSGDEKQPVCERCRAGNRECRRGLNLTFRYGLTGRESAEVNAVGEGILLFAEDQPWVPLPKDGMGDHMII
jgi:hypothetical protein